MLKKFQREQQLTMSQNNMSYVIAIVVMVCIGVLSTLMIFVIRPDKDNASLIATIGSFVVPTTMALLAFMKSQETHLVVNSRMDEFKTELVKASILAETAAKKVGIEEGQILGTKVADERTDMLADKAKTRVEHKEPITKEHKRETKAERIEREK